MKKNFLTFAIILLVNISVSAQLKFVESDSVEKSKEKTAADSTKGSKTYIELNKLGVQKGLVENDFKAALVLFSQALEENPACFICRYNVARSYLILGDLEASKKVFSDLVKIDSKFADGYAGLGEVYYKQKRFEESLSMYRRANELSPDDALLLNNYANSLSNIGEHKKALKFFDQSIKLDPNFANAYANRGAALYNLGRFKECLKDLQKAVRLDESNANIHNSLGVAYDELGKKKQALKHYREALRLNPEMNEVIYNMGVLYFGDGKNTEAEKQLKILEKKDFELARRLRKVLWSKYVLDAKKAKKSN